MFAAGEEWKKKPQILRLHLGGFAQDDIQFLERI